MKMIFNMLSKKAVKFVEDKLANLKAKLDADGDGVADFAEYPKLLEDIKEAGQQSISGVDMVKLGSGVEKLAAGVEEIKSAIDAEEVLDGAKKVHKAATELIKLVVAGVQKLAEKQGG